MLAHFCPLLLCLSLWRSKFDFSGGRKFVGILYRCGRSLRYAMACPTGPLVVDTVGEIPQWEYWMCDGITSITIGDSVTSIGKAAFSDCPGATSVIIGNSVQYIGESAFAGLQVTSITIPNSVTEIGPMAFRWCDLLTSITIPYSVAVIGDSAFRWCKKLEYVAFTGGTPPTCGSNVFDSTLVTVAHVIDVYSDSTLCSISVLSDYGYEEVVASAIFSSMHEARIAEKRMLLFFTFGVEPSVFYFRC